MQRDPCTSFGAPPGLPLCVRRRCSHYPRSQSNGARRGSEASTWLPSIMTVGGTNSDDGILARAEMHDPMTGRWRELPPMLRKRSNCSVVQQGGRVVVVGGKDEHLVPLPSVEEYDPRTETWQFLPPMQRARANCCAAATGDSVMVMGGFAGQYLADVEEYSETARTWGPAAPLRYGRSPTELPHCRPRCPRCPHSCPVPNPTEGGGGCWYGGNPVWTNLVRQSVAQFFRYNGGGISSGAKVLLVPFALSLPGQSKTDLPLASASSDVIRWSRVLLSHALDAARSTEFWWCGGRVLLSGLWYGANSY